MCPEMDWTSDLLQDWHRYRMRCIQDSEEYLISGVEGLLTSPVYLLGVYHGQSCRGYEVVCLINAFGLCLSWMDTIHFVKRCSCLLWRYLFSGFCVVLWRNESATYPEKRYFARCFDAQCYGDILCGKNPYMIFWCSFFFPLCPLFSEQVLILFLSMGLAASIPQSLLYIMCFVLYIRCISCEGALAPYSPLDRRIDPIISVKHELLPLTAPWMAPKVMPVHRHCSG